VVVAPYDAELFGHWWYEGPRFLESFVRKAAYDTNVFNLATPRRLPSVGMRASLPLPHPPPRSRQGRYRRALHRRASRLAPKEPRVADAVVEKAGLDLAQPSDRERPAPTHAPIHRGVQPAARAARPLSRLGGALSPPPPDGSAGRSEGIHRAAARAGQMLEGLLAKMRVQRSDLACPKLAISLLRRRCFPRGNPRKSIASARFACQHGI